MNETIPPVQVPASRLSLLFVLSTQNASGGAAAEVRQGHGWADRNGFEIVAEVIEPFNILRGPDIDRWQGLRSAADLAIRKGAPNLLISGLRNDANLTPWNFELLKVKVRRELLLDVWHAESTADVQTHLSTMLHHEVVGLADDVKFRAMTKTRRRDRGHGGPRPGGGRKRKDISDAEIAYIRENYKKGVQGNGVRIITDHINHILRGIPRNATRAELQKLGIGQTHVHNKIRELGLDKSL